MVLGYQSLCAKMLYFAKPSEDGSLCRGLFIFRGQGIPPIMKEECYDVDLYDWTKVDINDAVSYLTRA